MKTYEPDFMKDLRTHEANRQAAATLSNYVTKKRKKTPSHGTVFGIRRENKTMAEIHNEMIALKPFHIYNKARASKK
jgi:hypothetical protein